MYRFSRYWNRLAYLVVHLGHRMIWDQTGKNDYLLNDGGFVDRGTEAILCDR